uniref:Centrosome-associated protein 350 isoform X1 n=1 Tax=Petromyzon marinus TaxID=7757 RepID=A0AAJ7TB18_PETMA|nr:centrosome-associated protein 350 isoform X1 [Petromyzon marinus]
MLKREAEWFGEPAGGGGGEGCPMSVTDLSKAWENIHKAKSALRHIENRLEAVNASTTLLDLPVHQKPPARQSRKIPRGGGAERKIAEGYTVDALARTPQASPGSVKEARAVPDLRLRGPPLENGASPANVDLVRTSQFTRPRERHRQPGLTRSQLEARWLLSEQTRAETEVASQRSREIYSGDRRDVLSADCASVSSSVVDGTDVRILNDAVALDLLEGQRRTGRALMLNGFARHHHRGEEEEREVADRRSTVAVTERRKPSTKNKEEAIALAHAPHDYDRSPPQRLARNSTLAAFPQKEPTWMECNGYSQHRPSAAAEGFLARNQTVVPTGRDGDGLSGCTSPKPGEKLLRLKERVGRQAHPERGRRPNGEEPRVDEDPLAAVGHRVHGDTMKSRNQAGRSCVLNNGLTQALASSRATTGATGKHGKNQFLAVKENRSRGATGMGQPARGNVGQVSTRGPVPTRDLSLIQGTQGPRPAWAATDRTREVGGVGHPGDPGDPIRAAELSVQLLSEEVQGILDDLQLDACIGAFEKHPVAAISATAPTAMRTRTTKGAPSRRLDWDGAQEARDAGWTPTAGYTDATVPQGAEGRQLPDRHKRRAEEKRVLRRAPEQRGELAHLHAPHHHHHASSGQQWGVDGGGGGGGFWDEDRHRLEMLGRTGVTQTQYRKLAQPSGESNKENWGFRFPGPANAVNFLNNGQVTGITTASAPASSPDHRDQELPPQPYGWRSSDPAEHPSCSCGSRLDNPSPPSLVGASSPDSDFFLGLPSRGRRAFDSTARHLVAHNDDDATRRRRKVDRIEALKVTAARLASRLEEEAQTLARTVVAGGGGGRSGESGGGSHRRGDAEAPDEFCHGAGRLDGHSYRPPKNFDPRTNYDPGPEAECETSRGENELMRKLERILGKGSGSRKSAWEERVSPVPPRGSGRNEADAAGRSPREDSYLHALDAVGRSVEKLRSQKRKLSPQSLSPHKFSPSASTSPAPAEEPPGDGAVAVVSAGAMRRHEEAAAAARHATPARKKTERLVGQIHSAEGAGPKNEHRLRPTDLATPGERRSRDIEVGVSPASPTSGRRSPCATTTSLSSLSPASSSSHKSLSNGSREGADDGITYTTVLTGSAGSHETPTGTVDPHEPGAAVTDLLDERRHRDSEFLRRLRAEERPSGADVGTSSSPAAPPPGTPPRDAAPAVTSTNATTTTYAAAPRSPTPSVPMTLEEFRSPRRHGAARLADVPAPEAAAAAPASSSAGGKGAGKKGSEQRARTPGSDSDSSSRCSSSSILDKLKKFQGRLDESLCSPVHCFFSVFTAYHWAALALCFPRLQPKLGQYIHMQLQRYLTKREQRLRERRRRAKELLLWKQRLDTEEEEVRNIERMAVQARRDDRGRQNGRLRAPLGATPPSSQREVLLAVSSSPTLTPRDSSVRSVSNADTERDNLRDKSWRATDNLSEWSLSIRTASESECSSEVEGRIVALRDELARRKMMVERLQKEQRRRARERLRAHESSLRLQLQAYDTFICKAQGELENSKEPRPSVRPHARTHGSLDLDTKPANGSSALAETVEMQTAACEQGSFSSLAISASKDSSAPSDGLSERPSLREETSGSLPVPSAAARRDDVPSPDARSPTPPLGVSVHDNSTFEPAEPSSPNSSGGRVADPAAETSSNSWLPDDDIVAPSDARAVPTAKDLRDEPPSGRVAGNSEGLGQGSELASSADESFAPEAVGGDVGLSLQTPDCFGESEHVSRPTERRDDGDEVKTAVKKAVDAPPCWEVHDLVLIGSGDAVETHRDDVTSASDSHGGNSAVPALGVGGFGGVAVELPAQPSGPVTDELPAMAVDTTASQTSESSDEAQVPNGPDVVLQSWSADIWQEPRGTVIRNILPDAGTTRDSALPSVTNDAEVIPKALLDGDLSDSEEFEFSSNFSSADASEISSLLMKSTSTFESVSSPKSHDMNLPFDEAESVETGQTARDEAETASREGDTDAETWRFLSPRSLSQEPAKDENEQRDSEPVPLSPLPSPARSELTGPTSSDQDDPLVSIQLGEQLFAEVAKFVDGVIAEALKQVSEAAIAEAATAAAAASVVADSRAGSAIVSSHGDEEVTKISGAVVDRKKVDESSRTEAAAPQDTGTVGVPGDLSVAAKPTGDDHRNDDDDDDDDRSMYSRVSAPDGEDSKGTPSGSVSRRSSVGSFVSVSDADENAQPSWLAPYVPDDQSLYTPLLDMLAREKGRLQAQRADAMPLREGTFEQLRPQHPEPEKQREELLQQEELQKREEQEQQRQKQEEQQKQQELLNQKRQQEEKEKQKQQELQQQEQRQQPEVERKTNNADAVANGLVGKFVSEALDQYLQLRQARNDKIAQANTLLEPATPPQPSQPPRLANGFAGHEDSRAQSSSEPGPQGGIDFETERAFPPEPTARPVSPECDLDSSEDLSTPLAQMRLSSALLEAGLLQDDQDWFDEDFGLSSNRRALRQQQQQQSLRGVRFGEGGRPGSPESIGSTAGRIVDVKAKEEDERAREEEEEALFAVPHSHAEVAALVSVALSELDKLTELGENARHVTAPRSYLGADCRGQDIESVSRRVYKQSVFDLTKEVFMELHADDPNTDRPPWMKPRRGSSLYLWRIGGVHSDNEIAALIQTEVLRSLGLFEGSVAGDGNAANVATAGPGIGGRKPDLPRAVKWGKKSRDRVDIILARDLHEEEPQWVSYEDDELEVKMQAVDSIFEALLADTAHTLSQIYDNRAFRAATTSNTAAR